MTERDQTEFQVRSLAWSIYLPNLLFSCGAGGGGPAARPSNPLCTDARSAHTRAQRSFVLLRMYVAGQLPIGVLVHRADDTSPYGRGRGKVIT